MGIDQSYLFLQGLINLICDKQNIDVCSGLYESQSIERAINVYMKILILSYII